ncbi:hypothetical protein A1O3_00644 [Capronia epimyces CBS 606.96]|uniref:Uncharacterized protein n=1 Tax=Capronia epimyces CBS 606.96 TaxID=1182542 RepID=W9ZC53_9EURO|nr:uncharacterized protein A1O3_00644 [Capronia epimyces CBS 606.96]EXJ92094.1 hypothetical protein A1O3_00644 [Capronia epimyces CBS 606.96]
MRRRTRGAFLNLLLFLGALFFIFYLNGTGGGNGGGGSSSDRDRGRGRGSGGRHRFFAWSTVHYKTPATTLPASRGICPGLADAETSKPALVVARVTADGDTRWLEDDAFGISQKYHVCIYTADAPDPDRDRDPADLDPTSHHLRVPANRGHEAMAYLTFLIDNYAHIPAAGAVFVHGSRWAWHNDMPDYDNAAALQALNVSAALEPVGYHNLRCDWSASTCPTLDTDSKVWPGQASLATSIRAMLEPWNERVVSDAALPLALVALFGDAGTSTSASVRHDKSKSELTVPGDRLMLGRNDAVRAQCCAQFVVSRDSVWRHSRDEYIALRQWLLDGSETKTETEKNTNVGAAPPNDRVAGRILSYIWHILFIRPCNSNAVPNSNSGLDSSSSSSSSSSPFCDGSADIDLDIDLDRLNVLACPPARECYCRLYGRCDLQGCTSPERCPGQYVVPPHFRLPPDWAERHS